MLIRLKCRPSENCCRTVGLSWDDHRGPLHKIKWGENIFFQSFAWTDLLQTYKEYTVIWSQSTVKLLSKSVQAKLKKIHLNWLLLVVGGPCDVTGRWCWNTLKIRDLLIFHNLMYIVWGSFDLELDRKLHRIFWHTFVRGLMRIG